MQVHDAMRCVVSGTTVNVRTTNNSMHKMLILTIWKLFFLHKNVRRVQMTDGLCLKLRFINSIRFISLRNA